MSDLRTAAQQALDSINELFAAEQSEGGERGGHIRTPATREHLVRVAQARRALHESCDTLRAALAQEQAEPVQEQAEAMTERDHFDLARWHSRLGELADAYYAAGGTNPARWRARAELMQHALDAATGWRLRSALAVQERQQAEPAQEPVAWNQERLVSVNGDHPALGGLFVQFLDGDEVAARVYANDHETLRQRCAMVNTAPPRRTMVPLTEKEIGKLTAMFDARHSVRVGIARAIEKASWEKNHG